MNTVKRTLLSLSLMIPMLLSAATAVASPHYVETAPNVAVSAGQQIISFAQQIWLPPNPWNPSSTAKYIEEFQVHDSAHTQNGMYFAIETAGVPHGLGFAPGYEIDAAGIVNGAFMDPIVSGGVTASGFAYPGDTITTSWFGPTDPNAIAHGTPYIEMRNDNGSGMNAPGWTAGKIDLDYTAPYVDAIMKPYLSLAADPTWAPPFTGWMRNCWGDMPAANGLNNITTQAFLDYYVTADHVVHYAAFQTPGFLDTVFVDRNSQSLPGCGLSVGSATVGAVTYSVITTYGGM